MVISDLPSREPPPPATGLRRIDAKQVAVWTAVSLVAAVAWGVLALARGERISATWLVAGAVGS
jgi:carbon starvation protein